MAVSRPPAPGQPRTRRVGVNEPVSRLSRGIGPAAYRHGDRIEQIVRHRERLTPDAVAVRQAGRALSYRELVAMADRVAGGLTDRGVGPGDVAPVCLSRSPEFVGVLLGVLTTGAAYLAMDPGWPVARREYILANSGAKLLITSAGHMDPPAGIQRLTVADLMAGGGATPPLGLSGTDAACVFYTSGSTGRPKGVVSPHRGTVRVVVGNDDVPLDADTVFLQAAPLPWDGLSLELWAALLNGGCCVLLDAEAPLLDAAALREAVDGGVNSLWLTSSLFNVFVDEAIELFRTVRLALVGGERVSVNHVRRLLDRFPELPLVNGYGPAESTIFATTHVIRRPDVEPPSTDIPIGRPVPGTGVVIVDDALRPLPAGQPGEMLISGDGLAHGYLGDPDQTSRAFVEVDGVRHYRTGDLTVLDDGVFRYRGRIDRQLKVNGIRVEPGEVEAALENHPGVRSCSVVKVERNGRPLLVSLFESADEVAPTAETLRTFAAQHLLPAMVPAILHQVDRLPLGPTGKVDVARAAAMAELFLQERTPETDLGIGTATESAEPDVPFLSAARSLLGIPDLRLEDDIFAAGATSLDVVRLASRSAALLPSPVGLTDVYRTPTVQSLLDTARERAGRQPAGAETSSVTDAPLSHAQTSFWLSEQFSPGAADNMVLLAYVVTGRWEPQILELAFRDVIEHHAILRTVYTQPEPKVVRQRVVTPSFRLEIVPAPAGVENDVDAAAELMTADWWRTPFDLEAEPPFRVRVSRLDEGRYLLGLHLHHIAFDGWSERILMADLATAYQARAAGATPAFPAAPTYAAYSRAERSDLGSRADVDLRHWRRVLEPPVAPAFAPPQCDSLEGPRCELTQKLPSPLVSRLQTVASRWGSPTAALLSAAVANAVARTFDVSEVCVGTVAPSRPDPHFDNVVGYFVNPLPLVFRAVGDPGNRLLPTEAAEQLRAALNHSEIPFDELVRALGPVRGRNPWFQTWTVVQHEPPRGELSPHVRYRPLRLSPPSTAMELLVEAVPQGDGSWELVASCRADGIGEATLKVLVESLTEALLRYTDL